MILVVVALLCWMSFACGVWHADRQHLAITRRTLGRVIGRDVPALPKAVCKPTSWRRGAWRWSSGGRP